MRLILKIVVLLFGFLILSKNTYAATYYVSSTGSNTNPGTQVSPWQDLSYACGAVATAGSTIHVVAGNYVETAPCNLNVGINVEGEGPSSRIKSYYSSGAYISLTSSSAGTNGNQSISNLKLDGDNLTGDSAISVVKRSNVKIHDLTIVDFDSSAISIREASASWDSAPPSSYGTGNEIYNCTITNSTGTHDGGGGGMLQITSQDGILIHDNILTENSRPQGNNGNIMTGTHNKGMKYYNNKSYKPDYDGQNWNFHIEHGNADGGIEVYNNEFYGGDCPIDVAGVYAYSNVKGNYEYSWFIHNNLFTGNLAQTYHGKSAIDIEGPYLEDIWIYYNHFLNWANRAVVIIGWGPGKSETHRVYIRYNIFENNGWDGWSQVIDMDSYHGDPAIIDNIYIDNNVITVKPGASTRAINIAQNTNVGSTVSNVYFRNNILEGSNRGAFLVADNNGTVNGLHITNNILYNNVNSNNPIIGSNVTNYEFTNNLKTDPLFVDAANGNFNLQSNSPAINKGVDVKLARDYVGNPITGLPDIGAHEYQSSSATPTPTPTVILCARKGEGDANCDGAVNILDFEIWRREFLRIDTTTKADFDGSGGVSILDFEIWRRGFLGQ